MRANNQHTREASIPHPPGVQCGRGRDRGRKQIPAGGSREQRRARGRGSGPARAPSCMSAASRRRLVQLADRGRNEDQESGRRRRRAPTRECAGLPRGPSSASASYGRSPGGQAARLARRGLAWHVAVAARPRSRCAVSGAGLASVCGAGRRHEAGILQTCQTPLRASTSLGGGGATDSVRQVVPAAPLPPPPPGIWR